MIHYYFLSRVLVNVIQLLYILSETVDKPTIHDFCEHTHTYLLMGISVHYKTCITEAIPSCYFFNLVFALNFSKYKNSLQIKNACGGRIRINPYENNL